MRLKYLLSLLFFCIPVEQVTLHGSPPATSHTLSKEKLDGFLRKTQENLGLRNSSMEIDFGVYRTRHFTSPDIGKIIIIARGNDIYMKLLYPSSCATSQEAQETEFQINKENKIPDVPLVSGSCCSIRDLALLFCVGAEGCSYVAADKVSGRHVQVFRLVDSFVVDGMKICAIKFYIDDKLFIPLQVDFYDEHSKLVRRVAIKSFKNFDELWGPKIIEVSNYHRREVAKIEIFSIRFGD